MRNSTIIVKKKRCINCGNIDYHFSKKMCKQCATIASTQKRMEEFEDDSESFNNLVQDLDHVFSQYFLVKIQLFFGELRRLFVVTVFVILQVQGWLRQSPQRLASLVALTPWC